MSAQWDHEVDVLVVGTGAGAMVSAVTAAQHGAKTLIVEKSDLYGGTSATSGGGVWIPNSDSARAQGQSDSAGGCCQSNANSSPLGAAIPLARAFSWRATATRPGRPSVVP